MRVCQFRHFGTSVNKQSLLQETALFYRREALIRNAPWEQIHNLYRRDFLGGGAHASSPQLESLEFYCLPKWRLPVSTPGLNDSHASTINPAGARVKSLLLLVAQAFDGVEVRR